MSVEGIHWAQKVFGETMCPYRKALLFALGERHNIDTGKCIPDQEMLARDAGMSARTVRKYARILEDEGFIERRVTSRGVGVTTYYILHFDILEAQKAATNRNGASGKQRHNLPEGPTGTPVPDTNRNPRSGPNGSCVPVEKKHEDTKKNTKKNMSGSSSKPPINETPVLEAFDDLWKLWPRAGRERSRSKALVLDQLRRAAKLQPAASIVAAARAFVAKTDERYAPGLDRWLQQGRFEHFMPKEPAAPAETAKVPASGAPTDLNGNPVDWAAVVARYVRSGIWPNYLGGRPDELGYRGPGEPLEAVLANGRVGELHLEYLKINIDRLRAARTA